MAAIHLAVMGPVTSTVLGVGEAGLSVRIDAISVILLMLSSVLAWVILRFSATHLHGEPGEGRFTFWMTLTLAG